MRIEDFDGYNGVSFEGWINFTDEPYLEEIADHAFTTLEEAKADLQRWIESISSVFRSRIVSAAVIECDWLDGHGEDRVYHWIEL